MVGVRQAMAISFDCDVVVRTYVPKIKNKKQIGVKSPFRTVFYLSTSHLRDEFLSYDANFFVF